jgi:hypothetical protein
VLTVLSRDMSLRPGIPAFCLITFIGVVAAGLPPMIALLQAACVLALLLFRVVGRL